MTGDVVCSSSWLRPPVLSHCCSSHARSFHLRLLVQLPRSFELGPYPLLLPSLDVEGQLTPLQVLLAV